MTTWNRIFTNQIKSNSIVIALIALAISVICLNAQAAVTFSVIHKFNVPAGSGPNGFLAQGRDGWLYGTTLQGGSNAAGIAFKIKPDGTSYTVIHNFIHNLALSEGVQPVGGLTLGRDGNFYGVTENGGTPPGGTVGTGRGTIFKLSPSGVVTPLHTFVSARFQPSGALSAPVYGPDGNLYGVTPFGGNFDVGTIYKLNPTTKAFTVLYHFKSDPKDGKEPQASLIIGRDGNLYGTTRRGGVTPISGNIGTVFRINPNGSGYKVLYAFDGAVHGDNPRGGLVQGVDGNFYGTTVFGGDSSNSGTVYKLTPQGKITTLHRFNINTAFANGAFPSAGLVQGSDGNFYGSTDGGGVRFSTGYGVLFRITPQGAYTVLRRMNAPTDGALVNRNSSMVLHTNGMLYGPAMTGSGLNTNNGTLFRLDVDSRAFVKPDLDKAKAGTVIGLYGELAGATKVTFNGVNASFTRVSANFITARVPFGAATGIITVFKGTVQVKSLKSFLVPPTFTSFSPASGAVGNAIILTGRSLSQTTAVRFASNKAALFTVDNDNQLTVNVPVGAITGKITIVTKGGSAVSATNFTVTP
jgi:uncharacterized repeat protein (TIGR03803 family)